MASNCKIGKAHKIQNILFMPSINYYLAHFGFVSGQIIHLDIDKSTAIKIVKDFNLYYHPAKDCDWGNYKTVPFE